MEGVEEDGERDGLRTRGDSDGGRRRDQGTQETRGLRPVMGGKKARRRVQADRRRREDGGRAVVAKFTQHSAVLFSCTYT